MLIHLGLGTNLGNRKKNLATSIYLIEESVGKTVAISSTYATQAWGVEDQPDFLNQVIVLETILSPQMVLKLILGIETKMGRKRERKWYTRLIDIDLLLYGDHIIEEANLIVPHPYIQDRNFVLAPLAEIAPDLVHPVYKETVKELYEKCKDPLEVKFLSN